MESSTSTSHFRSVSLPSRLTNPSHEAIETKINELKASQDLLHSSQTIQTGLVMLAELYVCVDELFKSPQHRSETRFEDALEGSIVLLDSCSFLHELIMQIKEQMQILQSALRRKGDDFTVANQIAAYLSFRKKAKKNIIKSLGTLKHSEKKMSLVSVLDVGDHHVSNVSKVLGEVYAITISLFKTVLVFLSAKSKPTKGVDQILSVLALKGTYAVHEKYKVLVNELELANTSTMVLQRRARNKEMKAIDVQMTLGKLQDLDVIMDGLEAGLNCAFRRLVQNRASLLNMVIC